MRRSVIDLAQSRDLFLLLRTSQPGPYPTVEEADAYPYTFKRRPSRHTRRRTVAGAPEQVEERLPQLASSYGVDELVVVTIAHSPKARLRSYERLAEALGLQAGGAET